MGPSIKDIRFFGPFFDLPTYPCPILAYCYDCFSIAISDFWKPTHLPKDRISFVDAPYGFLIHEKNVTRPSRNIGHFFSLRKDSSLGVLGQSAPPVDLLKKQLMLECMANFWKCGRRYRYCITTTVAPVIQFFFLCSFYAISKLYFDKIR